MKKILNINLAGRVIPIEDAAYEALKSYTDSLRRYFAAEESGDEIIADIESRLAELMHERLRTGAAAITEADIDTLTRSMGRVEDFEREDAAEAATGADAGAAAGGTAAKDFVGNVNISTKGRGRLYRDSHDKFLGGVCSGIANYFNIDPALVRILAVLLIFGAGTGFFLYLLLWIILPARPLVGVTAKRLFRNPDERIFGGVAGGLAAYFRKDVWLFRGILAAPLLIGSLFGIFGDGFFPEVVFGSFGSTFILTYIVLWVILPEARSDYQKMEMRGEAVNVETIRQNIQGGINIAGERLRTFGSEVADTARNLTGRSRSEGDGSAERAPVMSAAAVSTGRSSARGCWSAVGLLFKILFFGFFGLIALAMFFALMAVLFSGATGAMRDFLFSTPLQTVTFWGTLLLFLGVPIVGFVIWIVRRLMKVPTGSNKYLGWSLGALWTLGWVSMTLFVSSLVRDFRAEEQVELTTAAATTAADRLTLKVSEPGVRYTGDFNYIDFDDNTGWDIQGDSLLLSNVYVRVVKSTDSLYHTRVLREAKGSNVKDAERRAAAINYTALLQDSVLDLGSGFAISREHKFRDQQVIVELSVPVGGKLRFEESFLEKLNRWDVTVTRGRVRNRRGRGDWDVDVLYSSPRWEPNVDYVMTAEGRMVDPLKPEDKDEDRDNNDNDNNYEYNGEGTEPAAPAVSDTASLQTLSAEEARLQAQQSRLDSQRKRLDERKAEELRKESQRINEDKRRIDSLIRAKGNKVSMGRAASGDAGGELPSPPFSVI